MRERRVDCSKIKNRTAFNPLNAELNPIRHLLALVGGRHIVRVSRLRVKRQDHGRFERIAVPLCYLLHHVMIELTASDFISCS